MFSFFFLAHGWMGWKNGNKPVSLVFHFSGRKRFHAITLTLYVERDFGIQVSCPTFFRVGNFRKWNSAECGT